MDIVKFNTDNWLLASSGVGLIRVLDKLEKKDEININGNQIEVPSYIFNNISDYFGNYILADFTEENFKEILEKEEGNEIKIYNKIVSPKILDFFTNSPIANPSLTSNLKINKNSNYEDAKREILSFLKKQINSLMESERSKKTCFFCRERKAYLKDGKPKVFESTNFTPLSASLNTVENFFYNGKSNQYLCPECEIFIYFSAFGFTRKNKKYLFVYTPDIEETLHYNLILNKEKDITKNYLRQIIEVEEKKSKWILENIYIVEIEQVGNSRANIYTLNIKPKVAKAFKEMLEKYPSSLNDIFKEFLNYVYSDKSLYEFLLRILSGFFYKDRYKNNEDTLENKGRKLEFLYNNLTYFIKFQEVLDMGEKEILEKQINWAYSEGRNLRDLYFNTLGPEKAKKRIETNSYRFLDSIRRKDIDGFCQNLIRAYLEVEKEIPSIFKDVLKDKSFNRITYAFLMGLNGSNKENSNQTQEDINQEKDDESRENI